MTTKRDALKARMTTAAAKRVDPEAHPAGTTAIRSKPVRVTLNIPPELYRQFVRWADEVADGMGQPRGDVQKTLRALIRVASDGTSPNTTTRVQLSLREHPNG